MNWGFIGCGNLAQAIMTGAFETGSLKPFEVSATNRSSEKLRNFAAQTKITACASNVELLKKADVIVLATKPQDICQMLEEISPHITSNHIFVSLAAGVTSAVLKKHLGKARAIIRVMANTPAVIQKGFFGIYVSLGSDAEAKLITDLFSSIGTVAELKNDKEVDAVTAGSASGTGFVLLMIEEFEKWFIKKGIKKEDARRIAVETFFGTASLARQKSDQTLKSLRDAVTSQKGTTFAGLKSMAKSKVGEKLRAGIEAAYRRSVEIGKNLRQN